MPEMRCLCLQKWMGRRPSYTGLVLLTGLQRRLFETCTRPSNPHLLTVVTNQANKSCHLNYLLRAGGCPCATGLRLRQRSMPLPGSSKQHWQQPMQNSTLQHNDHQVHVTVNFALVGIFDAYCTVPAWKTAGNPMAVTLTTFSSYCQNDYHLCDDEERRRRRRPRRLQSATATAAASGCCYRI